MNYAEQLNYLIKHSNQNENLAAASYQLIQSAPENERPHLLELFFQDFMERRPSGENILLPNFISKEEKKEILKRFGERTDDELEELLKQNLEDEEFYKQLWTFISSSPMFPGDKERAVAMYDYGRDFRMPYYHIDMSKTLKISSEEFYRIRCKLGPAVQKVRFIMRTESLEQHTQVASLLMQELYKVSDEKERCVLLAIALRFAE